MNDTGSRIVGLLTICRKAGFAIHGFDAVKDAIIGGKAKAVLLAADASDRTAKEICFISGGRLPVLESGCSMDELERYFGGKRVAVAAILDEGFAKRFRELCGETERI